MSITTNSENINHLEWIYYRLINVHKENPNVDYMLKFDDIIASIEQLERDYKAKTAELDETLEAITTGNLTYL